MGHTHGGRLSGVDADLVQQLADGTGQHQIGPVITRRGRFVDEDDMTAGKIVDESGGGVNGQRGAADNQQVGAADIVDGAFDHAVVQPLLIEDHVGFDDAAAGTGGDTGMERLPTAAGLSMIYYMHC